MRNITDHSNRLTQITSHYNHSFVSDAVMLRQQMLGLLETIRK